MKEYFIIFLLCISISFVIGGDQSLGKRILTETTISHETIDMTVVVCHHLRRDCTSWSGHLAQCHYISKSDIAFQASVDMGGYTDNTQYFRNLFQTLTHLFLTTSCWAFCTPGRCHTIKISFTAPSLPEERVGSQRFQPLPSMQNSTGV